MAESDTAYNTFVLESVYEINIKHARNFWVEDRKPIRLDLLLMSRETLKIQLRQCVANSELRMLVGNRMADLRRGCCSWVGVWDRLVQLRCGWSTRTTVQNTPILVRTG